jgi:hypothetical protein
MFNVHDVLGTALGEHMCCSFVLYPGTGYTEGLCGPIFEMLKSVVEDNHKGKLQRENYKECLRKKVENILLTY